MDDDSTPQVERYECPNCHEEMYAEDSDRYCLECIHEGRV